MVCGLVDRGDSISANARPTNIHADFIGDNLRHLFSRIARLGSTLFAANQPAV
jgi:hypothetical protein